MSTPIEVVRRRVLKAALRVLDGDLEEMDHSTSDAEAEYATEQLATAARDLVRATDALPHADRPATWRTVPRDTKAGRAAARLREELGVVTVEEARADVVGAALRRLVADYEDEDRGYADDVLALACKGLVKLVDGLPRDRRPVDWNTREDT